MAFIRKKKSENWVRKVEKSMVSEVRDYADYGVDMKKNDEESGKYKLDVWKLE